jgi:Protein of unknown function (DUF2630)
MTDADVSNMIESLVREEHELWDREARGEASDSDRRRLSEIKVQLDQYWDLLRQRRALREFGLDDESAATRRPDTVENYEQ